MNDKYMKFYLVYCPYCGSPPGLSCSSNTEKVYPPHLDRRRQVWVLEKLGLLEQLREMRG